MHLLGFREFDGYERDRFEQYMGKPLFWPVHARGEPEREEAIRLAASRWSRGLRARYYWTYGIEKHGSRWWIPNTVAAALEWLDKLCREEQVELRGTDPLILRKSDPMRAAELAHRRPDFVTAVDSAMKLGGYAGVRGLLDAG